MDELTKILRSRKKLAVKHELIMDIITEVRNEAFDKAKAHYTQSED